MKSRAGISIIIDCYNHERFVDATIRSALAQTHTPLQIIVIDDGSPDRSQEVIKGFGNSIQTILSQENQGQVSACRNALAHAEHDIIMFLDSDDLLEPHAASVIADTWREGVSKVQFCLSVIDEHGVDSGNVFPKYSAELTPERVRADILRTGSYPDSPTSGNAFDRRFLEKAMPLLLRRNGFDGELNGIAPLYGDVISLNQPLGSYRIHGDNDYAQSELDVGKFTTYLRHSEARLDFIRDHYQSMGQTIADNVLDNDLKYQEYALVVEKLGNGGNDEPRRLLRVARTAISAALRSPHTLAQRVYRTAWMMAVAIMPQKLAVMLIEQRFVPGRRVSLITTLATPRQRPTGEPRNTASIVEGLERPRPSSSHV